MKTPFILFLIAFALRLAVVIRWQFDGLYGQDSYAYFQQALALTENLPKLQPPPADFFWPNGFPLLIAFLMLFVGKTAFAGQLASLLSGALLAPLAYLLSRDLCPTTGRRAGILAGLIIAVAGQPLLSSVVVMADMPALFWATLSVWLVVRASRQPHPTRWYLLAGATLALAIVSRWLYVLTVPALGLYVLVGIRQNNRTWWQPGLAALSGMVILAPQMWLSLNKPGGLLHSWLLGWSPANFFQRQFDTLDGHYFYRLPVGVYYAQPAGHPAYIFPILGLAALWGLWRLWQTKHWGAIILLVGWLAPSYLFLAGIPYQNFRFGLTHYLPLVLLTGFGLSDVWERGRNRSSAPLLLRPPAVLTTLIVLSLLGMLAWAYPMLNNFLTAQNQSKTIARQVEQRLPQNATLLAFGLTLTLQHYTQLNTQEFFYFDEASLANLLQSQAPLYLLLDLDSVETQWQGKTPFLNYHWLQDNATLTEIGSFPPYVLFKVDPGFNKQRGRGAEGQRSDLSPAPPPRARCPPASWLVPICQAMPQAAI